ncbi:MAG: polysaccharide deacetylase family protein, partial [bacterium]
MAKNGYETISIADYVTASVATDKKVILTFDDAYASVFDNAYPILAEHGFTASIFPITKYIGKTNKWDYNSLGEGAQHCTWKQLRMLIKAGWEVGSHTESHRNLRSLSDKELWHEVKHSKDILEANLGARVEVISYPFGKYSAKVIEVTREAGYIGGCTLGYNYPDTQVFPYA